METMRSNHAVFSLGYHIIWCPKYRHGVLNGIIADELKQVILDTCNRYSWILQEIEVMPDHVHIFVQANHLTPPVEIAKT